MDIHNSKLYADDLDCVTTVALPWEKLQNKSILITGATGMVGSFLVDTLMKLNEKGVNCTVYALSRNAQKASEKFRKWSNNTRLNIISYDINQPLITEDIGKVDYVLHMASNTHPLLYSTDPIGTITTNIIGLKNMLDFAVEHRAERFLFTSSNEIYGENRGDVELFKEDYCGYINSNTLRAGYPESKRCGEALCQAYKAQQGIDIVIARVTRTYGATMSLEDTKAISQFIKKAVRGENIILKSDGRQYYSYTYVADAVSGLLYILLKGDNGEAYNISDKKSDITLGELANTIAMLAGKKVLYEIPDAVEAAGYSKATKARLDGSKLRKLGWEAKYDILSGIKRTISIMRHSM